jgi:TPR repeat protein
MKLLAEVLEEGEEPELAREWYTTAALLGDAEAMFELSVRCERVGQDDEARYWLTRAAANEWKDAQKKRDAMR